MLQGRKCWAQMFKMSDNRIINYCKVKTDSQHHGRVAVTYAASLSEHREQWAAAVPAPARLSRLPSARGGVSLSFADCSSWSLMITKQPLEVAEAGRGWRSCVPSWKARQSSSHVTTQGREKGVLKKREGQLQQEHKSWALQLKTRPIKEM